MLAACAEGLLLQKAFWRLGPQGLLVGRHLQVHSGDGRTYDDSVGSAIEGLSGLLRRGDSPLTNQLNVGWQLLPKRSQKRPGRGLK